MYADTFILTNRLPQLKFRKNTSLKKKFLKLIDNYTSILDYRKSKKRKEIKKEHPAFHFAVHFLKKLFKEHHL